MFVVVVAASMCGIQSVQNKKPEWGKIIASYFSMPSGPIWLHAFWGGENNDAKHFSIAFLKNGPIPTSFCLFSSFPHDTIQI